MGIDVEKLAREAGFDVHDRKHQIRVGGDALLGLDSTDMVRKFAALVLEEAAKVCEGVVSNDPNCVWEAAYKHVADEHAAAIRALAKGVE